MREYQEFLQEKMQRPVLRGFEVNESEINPALFKFQNAAVRRSLLLGKAALFEAVGLGKTIQQLEFARFVVEYTNKPVLILAWLGVAPQTIRQGASFGYEVTYALDASEIKSRGIYITNYERLEKFDCSVFGGVVADESSVLKNYTGKTKQRIIRSFADTPFKLACTATPAPNDFLEFGSHSEFLDIKTGAEMLATWFINDLGTGEWRLKEKARKDYWRWLTSWAVCISKPRDLGAEYDMQGYDLPALNIHQEWVGIADSTRQRAYADGKLLPDEVSVKDMHKIKRESLSLKLERAWQLIDTIPQDEPIIVWCETNEESESLYKLLAPLGAVVEVQGKEKQEAKERKLLGFSDGDSRIMITKPSIAGMGLNWQHCAYPIFFSPSFSFEAEHQALGRTHRFGQTREVNAYMIISEAETNIADVVARKRADYEEMQAEMNAATLEHGLFRDEKKALIVEINTEKVSGKKWEILVGDCIQRIKDIPSNSQHLVISSPPFADMFTFSDSPLDMSNVANNEEFYMHFAYLVPELFRVMKSGRLVAIHIKNMPVHQSKEGYMGLHDMPGEIIRMFENYNRPVLNPPDLSGLDSTQAYIAMTKYQREVTRSKEHIGFRFHGEFHIWKDPEIEMYRTKAHSILHKSFQNRAEVVRNGLDDIILLFRKWDKNMDEVEPVLNFPEIGDYVGTNPPSQSEVYNTFANRTPKLNYSIYKWARYASAIWWDIDQTDTLNVRGTKGMGDERHIVPLQLGVIKRLIDMYSNEGESVLDPFAGIGSVPVCALQMKRYGLGIELKEEYANHASKNCLEAEQAMSQPTLWDLMPQESIGD